MKLIKIPTRNSALIRKIRKLSQKNGMIVILGSDQNWNSYISLVVVNALKDNEKTDEPKHFVSFGEKDQYSIDWIDSKKVNEINPQSIVFAGDMRPGEKTKDAFKLAENCIVIGIVHSSDMDGMYPRFADDLGIAKDEIKKKILFVVEQKYNFFF